MQDELAKAVSAQLPSGFTDELEVIYLPQVGYLFRVDSRKGMDDPLRYYGLEGWDLTFKDESGHYFKTEQCRDIDSNVGDLQSFITDREVEISEHPCCRQSDRWRTS